jgi:hypothetical protein
MSTRHKPRSITVHLAFLVSYIYGMVAASLHVVLYRLEANAIFNVIT